MFMEVRPMLEGQVIIITGAASGIGLAAARLFTGYGAALSLWDVDANGLARAVKGLPNAMTETVDVTDAEAVKAGVAAVVARFGHLTGAFNNAGVEGLAGRMVPLADYPAVEYARVMGINAGGLWHCLQAQLPALLANGSGAIVNTASVMGWLGAPGLSGYIASKHAVSGLTRAAAIDYARFNIRVNAVLPGAIRTPMLLERGFKANPGFEDHAAAAHPIGRMGEPDEVAEAAAWLLSTRSSFVTGCLLPVDGGLSAV
jgi:NAD(P)-dependent dehydrogenase (short-subunit alcohol dehydrogenase family)